ncbi:DoxX family protein [Sphingomonas sp. VNH70]|uniref:DoxX family protein n=1 Tax=Sphingomonas silueang TaxID=3156617 RepID=UPI0032B41C84
MSASSPLRRIGQLLSGLVVLTLFADGAVQLFQPSLVAAEMASSGWPVELAPVIGGIAILCALLYALPQTAVLGAILIAGFTGGAIATHLRLGEIGSGPQLLCITIGVAAWAGLWLRGRISREPEMLPSRSAIAAPVRQRRAA